MFNFKSKKVVDERREAVFKKGGGKCHYCRCKITPRVFHIDHKIPRFSRGSDKLENLLAACRKCNIAKGIMSYEEFVAKIKEKGLKWRDKEFRIQMQGLVAYGSRPPNTPGRSNPAIGYYYRHQNRMKKIREQFDKGGRQ